jgi:hypothetical protein
MFCSCHHAPQVQSGSIDSPISPLPLPLLYHSSDQFPDESLAADSSQFNTRPSVPWMSPQTSLQHQTTNLGWPLKFPFESVNPTYDILPTFGYPADPAINCSNGQVGGVPLLNEWHVCNGIGKALPGISSRMRAGFLMSPDFTGFGKFKDFHVGRGSKTAEWEEKLTSASRSTGVEGESKANRTKRRLPCQYPGCKLTFPRNYELERHTRNVHDRDFRVPCFVYECKRTAKPFQRADKLREHLGKHHNPCFSCFIDGCGKAPLTMGELKDHLLTKHDLMHCKQPHLDALLGVLKLKRIQLRGGSIRPEEDEKCPLAFLGCDIRSSTITLSYHMVEHDLLLRSEGYETIVGLRGRWPHYGPCTCPICDVKVTRESSPTNFLPDNAAFVEHVALHTKAERALHSQAISKMLRPYLMGMETFYFNDAHIFHKLRAELEEVGAIQSDGSIPHEGATAGNIQ